MRSVLRALCVVLAVALVMPATRPAASQAMPVIRVVGPPNDGFKATWYGIRAGIFRKYGLDVRASIVSSGAAAAAALSGGAADLAFTNILTLVQAHAHSIPMQFVTPGGLQIVNRPTTLVIVLKDAPYRSGRDLNGKTIGSPSLRDINAAATLAWIDKTGGDSKSVHVVEVPASAGVAFLEEHRVEAVTMNEPAVSQAVASGKVRILVNPFEAVGTGETSGLAAMGPYIDAHKDEIIRFARAFHEASTYTNAHLPQTVDLVAAYSGATVDTVAHSVRIIDAEYLEPKNLQPLIDICAKYGLIDRDFPAQDVISSVALKPPR